MRCFGGAGRTSHAVGIDDDDNVFIRTSNKQPTSFVMVRDGTVYRLDEVTSPPTGGTVQGVSASGNVVGNVDGKHSTESFILTPLQQAPAPTVRSPDDEGAADLPN